MGSIVIPGTRGYFEVFSSSLTSVADIAASFDSYIPNDSSTGPLEAAYSGGYATGDILQIEWVWGASTIVAPPATPIFSILPYVFSTGAADFGAVSEPSFVNVMGIAPGDVSNAKASDWVAVTLGDFIPTVRLRLGLYDPASAANLTVATVQLRLSVIPKSLYLTLPNGDNL